jgi:plasmid replication initiation protein
VARPHPIREFFNFVDYAPKDSSEIMERPFCSLTKNKRVKPIHYTSPDGKIFVRVMALPEYGMATIWDFDILIYLISRVVAQREKNTNHLDGVVRCTPHQILKAISRGTSGKDYAALLAAIHRLKNTTVETNIRATKRLEVERFNWISEFGGSGTGEDPNQPLATMTFRLPSWLIEGIQQGHVLTLDREYFELTGGLEKALYRIARKHAGAQPQGFTIRLHLLQEKVGSEMSLRHFKSKLREIERNQEDPTRRLPRYTLRLTETQRGEDAVHFVDRSFESAEQSRERLERRMTIAREDARAAWIDAGRHPRKFEDAYEAWCASGQEPGNFAASIRENRLL